MVLEIQRSTRSVCVRTCFGSRCRPVVRQTVRANLYFIWRCDNMWSMHSIGRGRKRLWCDLKYYTRSRRAWEKQRTKSGIIYVTSNTWTETLPFAHQKAWNSNRLLWQSLWHSNDSFSCFMCFSHDCVPETVVLQWHSWTFWCPWE